MLKISKPELYHTNRTLSYRILKKLIAISLLFIHLFNIGGQLLLHQYFVYKSDKLFNEQINKNRYNVDDLTEIKIPVNMPQINDWKNFENLTGQVQFAYSSYNYVKIRVTRTAIFLMCIPNYETTHFSNHNIIYARQIPDIPVSKKEHVPFGKISLAAYNNQIIQYEFSTPEIVFRKNCRNIHSAVLDFLITGPCQPPDSCSLFS